MRRSMAVSAAALVVLACLAVPAVASPMTATCPAGGSCPITFGTGQPSGTCCTSGDVYTSTGCGGSGTLGGASECACDGNPAPVCTGNAQRCKLTPPGDLPGTCQGPISCTDGSSATGFYLSQTATSGATGGDVGVYKPTAACQTSNPSPAAGATPYCCSDSNKLAFPGQMIVKSGNGACIFSSSPDTTNRYTTPLNNGGNRAGLSHVDFCYNPCVCTQVRSNSAYPTTPRDQCPDRNNVLPTWFIDNCGVKHTPVWTSSDPTNCPIVNGVLRCSKGACGTDVTVTPTFPTCPGGTYPPGIVKKVGDSTPVFACNGANCGTNPFTYTTRCITTPKSVSLSRPNFAADPASKCVVTSVGSAKDACNVVTTTTYTYNLDVAASCPAPVPV